jgi:hypothetical protein
VDLDVDVDSQYIAISAPWTLTIPAPLECNLTVVDLDVDVDNHYIAISALWTSAVPVSLGLGVVDCNKHLHTCAMAAASAHVVLSECLMPSKGAKGCKGAGNAVRLALVSDTDSHRLVASVADGKLLRVSTEASHN